MMRLEGPIGSVMQNLGSFLRWTCPRCQQVVDPILGHTLVKDGSGYRMKCPHCEPYREVTR
jgi:phage FluMu protein Com